MRLLKCLDTPGGNGWLLDPDLGQSPHIFSLHVIPVRVGVAWNTTLVIPGDRLKLSRKEEGVLVIVDSLSLKFEGVCV